MFKRKLFKRALPIILSVAMVFQSAPTTAFAAESTTEPETVIEQSTEEVVGDETDDNGAGSSEAVDGQNEGGSEESKSPETQTTEETKAAETQTAEENKDAEETQPETEEALEEAADNADAALKAEIKISALEDWFEAYDASAKKIVKTFNDATENPFSDELSTIKNYMVYVSTTDEYTEESLRNNLIYTWQVKGEDGNYKDMAATEVPVNAGEYKLVISLDPSLATADPVSIDFEIKKAELTVNVDDFVTTKTSGVTVKEIKDEIKEVAYIDEDLDKFKDAVKPLTITVRESTKTEALADETVLKKGNDYSVDIVAELTDAYKANYEIKQLDVIDLKIDDLQTTALTITNNLVAEEKEITRTFNGEAVAAPTVTGEKPEISVEVTVVGEEDEATGKDKVLLTSTKAEDYAKLTKTWYDADHHELEGAPVDAGVYFYEIKYTDADGIYAESKDEVKVVVEAAKIVLKPALSVTEYLTGATASDVTNNATYTLAAADGTTKFDFDPETFWGVSYNNPSKPQSYAPVFKLQKGETKTVDGKAKTTWTDVTGTISDPSGAKKVGDQEVTISYRLVPKGTKALFTNGNPGSEIDIHTTDVNTAEKNYEVDLSAAVVETNAVAVTVKSSANATIDVSAMIPEGMGSEDINKDDKLYTKIYDGVQLYADRAAYKKAVVKDADGKAVKDADGNEVKDTNSALTYTWYYLSIGEDIDDNGNKVKKPVLGSEVSSKYAKNPSNAGYYALKISYYDAEHKYTAKPAYVYFQIKPQLIKVVPAGAPDVYAGVYVSDYIEENEDSFNYTIKKIPGNDLSLADDKLEEIAALSKENNKERSIYSLRWYVLEGDNTDKNVAKFSEYWSDFKLGVPYKLAADLDFVYDTEDEKFEDLDYSGNYSDNYMVVVDSVEQTECTSAQVDINVKPMGSTEIDINVDLSKLTTDTKVYDGKPIDLSADIANGLIKVTNKVTGEAIPVTGENAIGLTYVWKCYDYEYDYEYDAENITDAYAYRLYVKFNGDDTYKAYDSDAYGTERPVCNFTIKPRELTITPVLKETITAGLNMSRLDNIAQVFDESKTEIKGYIEEDAEAFAYTKTIADAKAFTDEDDDYKPIIYVNGSYLRTGTKYKAEYKKAYIYGNGYEYDDVDAFEILNEDALKDKRAENYKLVATPVEFQTNKRGNSTVDSTYYSHNDGVHEEYIDETRLKATYNDLAATIVPVEGIPYSYEVVKDEEGNWISGNFFVFKITKPAEFYSDGNYSLSTKALYENSIKKAGGYVLSVDNSNIIVAFNAAKPATGDNIRTFDIRWEDGYVENFTVDFKNAELEDDLTVAVAPKSLAFNGVDTKMIAGENQQLDVKITKNQIDDIVCLNYEVTDGKDFVSVTNKGYVTALKKGTATISVYPVRYDMKGNMEKLDFKAVTTKITVSDVSAPKINKAYAYDTAVRVTYTRSNDGYRREIYVLPGKLKAQDFEDKIAAMNQGQFDGKMIIADDGSSSSKTHSCTIDGLDIETEYTVYVRNVSGIRTIEDGSFVALSHNGSVQTFKTTKVQLDGLKLYFDDKQKVTYDYDKENDKKVAVVNLSEKSVKITAAGWFKYKPENAAADGYDYNWYDLPLTAQQKNIFVDPKLTFYATESDEDCVTTKKDGYTLQIGGSYYKPSQIAKVDKKGNIKLNGIGYTYICVYDSISGQSYWYPLHITSDITKITAKPVTLKVGQYYGLMNSLTFYNGNAKLKGHIDQNVVVEIVSGEGIGLDEEGRPVIYCKAPDKTAQVKVSLADKPEVSTTVTIKTKALDPVKSLKATNIMDKECTITFTHSVWLGQYKIEIRNGRDALVRSELFTPFEYDIDWSKSNYAKYIYTYKYKVDGLVRKSDYKISVTPVCEAETAKAATVKVKTTDVPASRDGLLNKDAFGGMGIYRNAVDNNSRIDYGYFTSGISYTLRANAIKPADGRATDTLTWKSSNTKVATVKAVPNTYTATFTALKAGYTDIEVSSKIRKGVIARYRVRVKAVGAAGDSELGDFEEVNFDPYYEGTIEVLTENNPVKVVAKNGGYDYTWVKFQAPAYGSYTFTCNGRISSRTYYEAPYNEAPVEKDYVNPVKLNEGDTVYLQVYGSFTMTVSGEKYQKLTTTTPVNSSKSKYVVFTAPEDNCYTFEATRQNMDAYYTKKSGETTSSGWIYFYNSNDGTDSTRGRMALKKGDVVTFDLYDANSNYEVSVKTREVSKTELSTTAVSTGELKKGDDVWYQYTATAAGKYTFKSTEATGVVKAEYYTHGIMDSEKDGTLRQAEDGKNFEGTVMLKKGDTVLIRVYTESTSAVTAKVSVVLPAFDTVVAGTAKDVTVAKGGETWVSFEVDEDDTMYNFKITGDQEKGTSVTATFFKNNVTNLFGIRNGNVIDYPDYSLNKGDIIYIKLTTDNEVDDSATVKVLATKRTATVIAAGESKDLTVENGGLYFYEFTAPSAGLYVFESKVTANTDKGTHKIVANGYSALNSSSAWPFARLYSTYRENDFYKEIWMEAGRKIIFAVEPTGSVFDAEGKAVTTQANISVTKVTAETLPGESITFAANSKGAVKWYKFTAATDDVYSFAKDVTKGNADITWSRSLYNFNDDYWYGENTSTSIDLVSKGDSVYFKVVAASDDETNLKLTVTGKKSSIQEIPASAFEIKGGETVTYKYTVKKAGRYKVDVKSNTEDINANVRVYTSDYFWPECDENVTSSAEIPCTIVGRTYYFEVSTNNIDANKKASVSLSMTEIQPTALEGEKTVTVEPNKPQWFAYTVPATGRYIFAATTGEKFDTDYTDVKYYNDLKYEDDYDYNEKWLKKDKVIYIRVDNTTAANASVKLSAKQIVGEEVTAGTAKEVALAKNETKWFKFTADADTYYSFDVKNAENMETDWYYYKPIGYDYCLGDEELKAGETVLIKMTRTDDDPAESLKATLTITKRTYTTLKEKEDLTITVKNGDSQYIEFTPSKTGYYEFYVKDVPTGVTVTGSSDYVVRHCTIAQKVHFQIGANFTPANADETKSFTLYAAEVAPAELTSEADVTVAKNQKAWFTFTAPDDGRYTFSDNSADVVVKYDVYKKNTLGAYDHQSGSTPFEYAMLEGDKIYVAVNYSDKKATSTATETPKNASFKLSVAKIEPTAITAAETSVELAANAHKWYSYTAAKTGEYKFSSDAAGLELYTSMADSTPSYSGVLAAGETVYVKVTNNFNETKTAKVTVATTEATALALGTELEAGFTDEEIAAGTTTKYLAFKAPKTGYYKFTEEAVTGSLYARLCRGESQYALNNDFFIKEGNTVFVKVYTYSWWSAATTKIKVENSTTKFVYDTISLDQKKNIKIAAGKEQYLEFTAPSTGTYNFFSTNANTNTYAYLLDSNMNMIGNAYSYGYYDYEFKWDLKKGETVYLKVKNHSSSYDLDANVFVKEVK